MRVIKYLGSKRRLVGTIGTIVDAIPGVASAWDAFAGTTRVGQALKQRGIQVHSSDLATYSEAFGRCYVEADADQLDHARLAALIEELNGLPGRAGYVTRTFCDQARFFHPDNGRRIDAIRAAIDDVASGEVERGILLTSLLEAADRVDSTCGVQMAYLKQWAPRALRPLELRVPELLPGTGTVDRGDANELAPGIDADLAYLDPPYNQHSYRSNYHAWETIVRADEPEAYGTARKRVDCRDHASPYNRRREAARALEDLLGSLRSRWVLVSFSNEGFIAAEQIVRMLADRGEVAVLPVEQRRYIGAVIGIHDPSGRRVGQVGHLTNREYLFLAGPDAVARMDLAAGRLGAAASPREQPAQDRVRRS